MHLEYPKPVVIQTGRGYVDELTRQLQVLTWVIIPNKTREPKRIDKISKNLSLLLISCELFLLRNYLKTPNFADKPSVDLKRLLQNE